MICFTLSFTDPIIFSKPFIVFVPSPVIVQYMTNYPKLRILVTLGRSCSWLAGLMG